MRGGGLPSETASRRLAHIRQWLTVTDSDQQTSHLPCQFAEHWLDCNLGQKMSFKCEMKDESNKWNNQRAGWGSVMGRLLR